MKTNVFIVLPKLSRGFSFDMVIHFIIINKFCRRTNALSFFSRFFNFLDQGDLKWYHLSFVDLETGMCLVMGIKSLILFIYAFLKRLHSGEMRINFKYLLVTGFVFIRDLHYKLI